MSHYPQVSDTELTWKLVSFLPQTVTTTHLIHLQQSVTDAAASATLLSDIAEKISPIGIDVTVLWSVCLSVMFVHCVQTAEDIDRISFAYHSPMFPRSRKIWLTSVRSTHRPTL